MHERRAFDLSRPRALRAPGSEYFLHQSLASTASFSGILRKFLVIIAGKNSRERQKRREKKNNERKTSRSRESVFIKHQHDLWYKVRRNISRPKRRASPQKALLFPSSSDACFASTWSSPRTLYISFFLFQRVLVSFNYVFFMRLFFFPVLSRIFYKNEDEKSNQKISRDEPRERIKKRTRGEAFLLWMD